MIEDALWSGSEYRQSNPGARAFLENARKLVLEHKCGESLPIHTLDLDGIQSFYGTEGIKYEEQDLRTVA
jgi:hypothetical protein